MTSKTLLPNEIGRKFSRKSFKNSKNCSQQLHQWKSEDPPLIRPPPTDSTPPHWFDPPPPQIRPPPHWFDPPPPTDSTPPPPLIRPPPHWFDPPHWFEPPTDSTHSPLIQTPHWFTPTCLTGGITSCECQKSHYSTFLWICKIVLTFDFLQVFFYLRTCVEILFGKFLAKRDGIKNYNGRYSQGFKKIKWACFRSSFCFSSVWNFLPVATKGVSWSIFTFLFYF